MTSLPSLVLDTNALADLYGALEPTSAKGWNYNDGGTRYLYFISQGSEYTLQEPTTTAVTTLGAAEVAQAVAGVDALVQALNALPDPPTALTGELSAWAASLGAGAPVSGLEVATLVTHVRNNQGDDKATLRLGYLYCPPLQGPLPVYLSLHIDWAGTLASLDAAIHLLALANLVKTVAVLAAQLAEMSPPTLAALSVLAVSLSIADVVVKQILNAASDGGQLNLIGVMAHAIQNLTSCVGPWSGVSQPDVLPRLDLDGLGYKWVTNQDHSSIIQDLSYSYQTANFPVTASTYPPPQGRTWMLDGNQLLTYGYDWSAQYAVGRPEISWSAPGGFMLMTAKVEVGAFGSGNTYALMLMFFSPTAKLLRVSAFVSSGSTGAGIVCPPEDSYDSSYLDFDIMDDTGTYSCCRLSGVIDGEVAGAWDHYVASVLQLMYIVPQYMSACATNVLMPQPSPAPIVTGIRPWQGQQGQVESVTLRGSFAPGATCDFGPGIALGPQGMNTGTSLVVVLTIAADAPTGGHDVTVTNPGTDGYPDGTSTTVGGGFFVRAPNESIRPHIDTLTPDSGTTGTSLTVTIAGSGFVAGSTCDFGPSIQVTACTFVDANTMSAAVTIPEGAALGPIQVQVTDPHQQQHPASADFTVLGLPLEVDGINPSQGAPGQPMSLTITGANFQPGATCSFGSGSGIQVDSCTPVAGHESRLLAVDIRIADDAKSGLRGDQVLTVTNPDNQSATGRFHVRVAGSPIVDQVTPASGVPGDHLTLTITGYGFGDPIRCEFSAIDLQTGERIPSGITVDACTVNNPNQLTVAISIAPDASFGLRELLLVKPAPTPRLGACGFVVERAP